jgi:hypothetical protein
VSEVKQEFKDTVQERYSEEGVKEIKIKEMETEDGDSWTIEGEVILKNGSKKRVSATIDIDSSDSRNRLVEFCEEDIK